MRFSHTPPPFRNLLFYAISRFDFKTVHSCELTALGTFHIFQPYVAL